MKRRLLAIFLSLTLMLSLVPSAWADVMGNEEQGDTAMSGDCSADGSNVTWELEENSDSLYCVTKTTGDTTSWRFYENEPDAEEGSTTNQVRAYTLTISGEGAMADYDRNTTPWGLALAAKLLNEEPTDNNVSDFCSPHITQVVFTEDSNVTYIGAHAFRSTSISSITIPASVESIGDYAFIMCRQLKSITAAGSNDKREFYVEDDVVYQRYGNDGLALRFFPLAKWAGVDYTIDSSVTAIGSNSMQMSEIKSVTIHASVRSINSYAFNSTALTSVIFADGCEPSFGTEFEDNELSPGAGAFSNCKNLITINFPQNVTELPNSLFSGDVDLTGFTIPDSVTEIGNSAFANTGITEIEIPAGVTTIGSGVFSTSAPAEGEQPVRTSIAVNFEEGSNLTSIGSACFDGLSYKATFDAEDTLASKVFSQAGYQISFYDQTLPEDENLVYGWADASSLMVVGLTETGEKSSSIAIPATATAGDDKTYPVVGIGDSVFAGTAGDDTHANTTLESVKLGANIEFIGGRAFRYCTELTTVDFSEAIKLERIGNNAFYDAKSVTAWDLSACTALTTVEDSAFLYGFGKTTTIKLPDSITSWGKNVISSAPVKVYVDVTSTTFTTLVSVLDKKSDTFTFGGETGVYENLAYETQYKNGKYTVTITGFASEATKKDEVVIPDEIKGMKVTAVAEKAFSDAYKQIKRVTIGKNVSQIGNYAFASSRGSIDGTLESVTFNEGVPVSVGTRAFQKYRNNFKTFDAGNRELTLGDNVFLGSSALTLINIPNVKSLGKGVFHGHENTEGTLIINGEAACDPLTFKNSTDHANAADSLTKMTIYALGSANEVRDEVKALGGIGNNILCLTNGGVIDVTQDVDATTVLYTPVYNGDGKVFDGWYANGQKLTNAASHGTYTAEWLKSVYTVDPTEVKLSYTYDDKTLTAGTVEVTTSGEGSIRTATVNSENFTLAVDGLKITVTPKSGLNAGKYEGTIVVTTGDSATHTVSVTLTVAKKSIPVPSEDNTKYTYTGEDQTYQVKADKAYTVTGNVKKDAGKYTVIIGLKNKANTIWAGKDNADDLKYAFVIYKAAQDAPAAPTRKDRSYTSITLNEVAANSTGATAEYSMDGENWQPSPTFTGLTSGTTYTFYVRYAATDNYNASPASDAVKFTTRRHSSATVTPTPTPKPEPTPDDSSKFADVPANAYFADAVKWAVDKGITNGLSDTMFGPYESCTRAQIVTFLWRAAGSPEPKAMSSFADVSTDAYYAKAVAWAVENGITTGTGDGKFSPDATCTRAQSVTFLFRAIGKLVDSKAEFSDVLTDSYYANAVAWAVENGVTNGIGDGLFGPDNSCTRAQIVTFLFRAYQGK